MPSNSADAATTATPSVRHISVLEAAALLRDLPPTDRVHIDVRNRDEWEAEPCGIIPGAVRISLPHLSAHHLPDSRDTHLLFGCMSGKRSSKAAELAASLGYTNVYTIDGGFTAWKECGTLPVAKLGQHQPFVKCFFDAATSTCQYVVSDDVSRDCVIIDPVMDYDAVACTISYANVSRICIYVRERGLNVTHILETHAHADHLTGAQRLKQELGGQVCIGAGITAVQTTFMPVFGLAESDFAPNGGDFDVLLEDKATFKLGTLTVQALSVPGHTPDHMCYVIGDSVFVGDTIFMPDSGSARCDFPGGSATNLFTSVRQVLFSLPAETRVFVGHDYQPNGRKLQYESTVELEKAANIHVALPITQDEFVKVRSTRDKTLGNPKLLYPSLQFNIRAGKLPFKTAAGKVLFTLPISVL